MLIKRAHVPTRNATRYIARICRHFSHKLPASWEDNMGEVTFPTGVCQLEAKEDALEPPRVSRRPVGLSHAAIAA